MAGGSASCCEILKKIVVGFFLLIFAIVLLPCVTGAVVKDNKPALIGVGVFWVIVFVVSFVLCQSNGSEVFCAIALWSEL